MGVMKGMTEVVTKVCQYLTRGGLGGVVEECTSEIKKVYLHSATFRLQKFQRVDTCFNPEINKLYL